MAHAFYWFCDRFGAPLAVGWFIIRHLVLEAGIAAFAISVVALFLCAQLHGNVSGLTGNFGVLFFAVYLGCVIGALRVALHDDNE